MAQIGFVGTGNMGIGMALNLLKVGHNLRIFNRTTSKAIPLIEKGAIVVNTPKEVAKDADVIISMVGDDIASKNIWTGDNGVLSTKMPKKPLIIECSTLSHDWVLKLSKIVSELGLAYLDCPVTGLPNAALDGNLTLFLGGDKQIIAKAKPYLSAISNNQIHFGEVGSATAYKLIVNLMGSIQIAATAEGLLVAEKAGLDLDLVAIALGTSASGSPQVKRNSKLMVEAKHDKNILFNAHWRLKDTRYGLEFAQKMGQTTPLGKVAKDSFQKLVDAGYAKSAESKIIDILKPIPTKNAIGSKSSFLIKNSIATNKIP